MQVKDEETRQVARARLLAVVGEAREQLRRELVEYEATGDHDHGSGPIRPGGMCGSGEDCIVGHTRKALAELNAI